MKRLALLLFALPLALFACEDTSPSVPCVNEIPPGGCPGGGADDCMDPSCTAVYACENGDWVLQQACPPISSDAGDSATDATGAVNPFDAAGIDAPAGSFGGPGCTELEMPDCPLGTAIVCSSADCCGCNYLYVCGSGGWNPWGTCSADAGIQPGG